MIRGLGGRGGGAVLGLTLMVFLLSTASCSCSAVTLSLMVTAEEW